MQSHRTILAGVLTALFIVTMSAKALAEEVTLIGNVLNNTHTGQKEKGVFIYAFDGTPRVKTEFEQIVGGIPDKGLDADAAEKLQDRFTDRLMYSITGPMLDELHKQVEYGSKVLALTGTASEKGGKRTLEVSKIEPGKFSWPRKLLRADEPLVRQEKEPLELKIGENSSLKCVYIPAGVFFMGAPYYQFPRWQEDPPHRVTLTRPYYIGETCITQNQYEALMRTNPGVPRGGSLPVNGIYCHEMDDFCQKLSEKTGQSVRLATGAEWEYAARCGTSNPTFTEKHADQNAAAGPGYSVAPLPAKSRKPNAWGLYDLCAGSWELVSDGTGQIDRAAATNPRHIPAGEGTSAKHDHMGKGGQDYPISEIEFLHPDNGKMIRFRVVVEIKDPGKL